MSEDATLDEFVDADSDRAGEGEKPELIQGVAWSTIEYLPDEWTVNNVESDIDILSGNNFSSDHFVEAGGIPLIRIRDLAEDDTTVNFEGRYDTKYLIDQQDLLVGMDGEFEPHLWTGPQALLNQRVCKIEPKNQYNKVFFRYAIEKPLFYIQKSIAGTTVKHLSQSNINDLNLPTPPRPEQRKIATVLYTVDRAIEKTEEIIEKYQSIISGLIQDIATTGIDNDNLNEEKVPMLPERWTIPTHWELEFLENISTLITDGAHQTPTYVDSGVPFLKVEDIKQDKIDWDSVARIPKKEHDNLIKRGNPTKGDVLLSKNGTIGISKVVDWDRKFSHFVSLALIRPNQDIILSDYLATLLESQICMRQANARSKTGTVTNLHLEEIEKLSIPVPPIPEQREILEKISTVENCLYTEVKYRNRLQRLKQGLTQDLLSGTVRTTDTNIEVPDEIAQYG